MLSTENSFPYSNLKVANMSRARLLAQGRSRCKVSLRRNIKFFSYEGPVLETSASLSLHGGNLTFICLFTIPECSLFVFYNAQTGFTSPNEVCYWTERSNTYNTNFTPSPKNNRSSGLVGIGTRFLLKFGFTDLRKKKCRYKP